MATAQPHDDLRGINLHLARSTRWKGPEAEETLAIRRDIKEAKLSRFIEKIVSEAPPLTPEQIDRISALLRPAE